MIGHHASPPTQLRHGPANGSCISVFLDAGGNMTRCRSPPPRLSLRRQAARFAQPRTPCTLARTVVIAAASIRESFSRCGSFPSTTCALNRSRWCRPTWAVSIPRRRSATCRRTTLVRPRGRVGFEALLRTLVPARHEGGVEIASAIRAGRSLNITRTGLTFAESASAVDLIAGAVLMNSRSHLCRPPWPSRLGRRGGSG